MTRRKASRTIAAVGEFGFLSMVLRRLPTARGTLVGPGQDCAVVEYSGARLLFTVDALVEGVHFETDWLTPRQIGRKSLLVNVSDVAAMGGRPRACVVSLGTPPDYRVRDLAAVQAGIVAAAGEVGASVVGGNLSRADHLFISIALLAEAPRRLVTRRGACPGDRVYVTGTIGDAALAVRLLQRHQPYRGPRHKSAQRSSTQRVPLALLRRFREPVPRLTAGQVLADSGIVSAMIDISDGLLQDLGHICDESGVGAVIDATTVPLSPAYRAHVRTSDRLALRGGEDYELLCSVPERNVKRLQETQRILGCQITHIGEITARRGVRVTDGTGTTAGAASTGYDHFLKGWNQ